MISLALYCNLSPAELKLDEVFRQASRAKGPWPLQSLTVGDFEYCMGIEDNQPDLAVLNELIKVAPRMTSLTKLQFYGYVGVEGAKRWAKAAKKGLWPQMSELAVGNVDEDGVRELAGHMGGFRSLEDLEVVGMYMAGDGSEVEEMFPGISVEFYE